MASTDTMEVIVIYLYKIYKRCPKEIIYPISIWIRDQYIIMINQ